ncbi:hypothetical protein [Vibrio sagamiensis]|uniref:Uncharacterized protein n=1 Tax=Vibrio sagamiensis NBRC 104589 TaxID=1219064 RepID=A0A511QK18_9VIBR|nr:hypothetical protein [Vibrio sagamiensis]GEM77663.1 hypothetical protein VSA01S_37750 [Vibrio sagamiensis NBRC 104589]
MKFTIPLLLSVAVLSPNMSVAAENKIQVTSDKEQVVSHYQQTHISDYLPIEKGNYYEITTSGGRTFTVYVDNIKGSWISTGGRYFNIDNITSVIKI